MKSRTPLADAELLSRHLVNGLRDHPRLFTRVEVAGSIRRRRVDVGDIEIVALAAPDCRPESVRVVLERLHVYRGPPNKAGASAPWGVRYYRGVTSLPCSTPGGIGMGVDLFVVLPPAEWGVVFAIRTGSAEFSQACVTRLHRFGLKSEQGRIIRIQSGEVLPCPSESEFLRYARLPWIPPELREISSPEFEQAFRREWGPGEELPGSVS